MKIKYILKKLNYKQLRCVDTKLIKENKNKSRKKTKLS